jgi:hypothetical protein
VLNVQVETVPTPLFDSCLYEELHALAQPLVHEDFDHFLRHCETNDLCHVFRDPACGAILGFQFWRLKQTTNPAVKLIWGGKLRIHPSIRGRGLHLLSNLMSFEHFNNPSVRFYRLGLVNILAFNSITAGLAQYDVFPFSKLIDADLFVPRLHDFCDENGFHFDEGTGAVDVGHTFSEDTLSRTAGTDGFWQRPKVKEFIELNPRWQDRDVFVGWEWNTANFRAMRGLIERKAQETITTVEIRE